MTMVFEYMSGYIGMLAGALVLLVVQATCDLSLPNYMSDIVDTGVLSGNVSFILQTGLKMVLITLLSAAPVIFLKIGRKGTGKISRNSNEDMPVTISEEPRNPGASVSPAGN